MKIEVHFSNNDDVVLNGNNITIYYLDGTKETYTTENCSVIYLNSDTIHHVIINNK